MSSADKAPVISIVGEAQSREEGRAQGGAVVISSRVARPRWEVLLEPGLGEIQILGPP